MANPLKDATGLAEIKRYFGITDTSKDAILNAYLDKAWDALKTIFVQNLERAARTIKKRWQGELITLPDVPVAASPAPTVKIDGETWTEFDVLDNGILQINEMERYSNPQFVEVTYTGGPVTLPKDIRHVGIEIAVILAKAESDVGDGRFGLTSVSLPDGSVGFIEQNLSPLSKRVVAAHRQRV